MSLKRIAIYSRKSKFVEQSDSVENQVQICKNYILNNFNTNKVEIITYEDDGFSGKNIDRPRFKQLIKDAKNKTFDILICYRLDRISRNVADFSSIITLLESYNISFISIKEQFDTSTPMGRAMMYISSVFAQLERETISERVRDNMLEEAKTGKWLGGNTPLGYVFKKHPNGESCLKQDKEKIKLVKLMYKKFIEKGALGPLSKFLNDNNIRKSNGNLYYITAIRDILTNPNYCIADNFFKEYAIEKNMQVFGDDNVWENNSRNLGVMVYNRFSCPAVGRKKANNTDKWIIAIGSHEGIINGKEWVYVNNKIQENSQKKFKSRSSTTALLNGGIIKCAKCKSNFIISHAYKNGERIRHYYVCSGKSYSYGAKCTIKNINGKKADKLIMDYIKELNTNTELLNSLYNKNRNEIEENNDIKSCNDIKQKISKYKNDIDKLTEKLIFTENTLASKYIIEKIDKLGNKITEEEKKLRIYEIKIQNIKYKNINLETIKDYIKYLIKNIDILEVEEKQRLIKNIFSKIVWDGENLNATLRKWQL
ncbi:recombinase family protein [Clostridium rectalis]|uniref:recombinase family protein n=1 Tax=Clostridium rectalis TaxID=2040295 RepID=UPI000F63C850|nr:recombinase family protein [Clostridium rectalis]